MPEVSIVMPIHNSEDYVGRAIDSVFDQTFLDWELLVVDDASSDASLSLVKEKIGEDARVRVHAFEENKGAAVARNHAISKAKGRYIAFLDSDDLWLPGKLKTQLDFMKKNNASFVFSSYRRVDELGDEIGVVKAPEKAAYNDILKSCSIGCLTVVYDTSVLGKVEMPLIRKRQDLALWLRLLKVTQYAYGVPHVLAEYTVRKGSISSDKKVAACYQWKVYREIEGLNLFKSVYFFLNYAAQGVFRRMMFFRR
ncbi:glycosyltransferase family 2 protein [Halomonas getboli]|uniref:glycosyltransferase family 2 protein n=1 Tax=Halomonas getboli TaxID=2935862 RepID=UPI001FFE83D0|nr:glycosyltransferase family 2 protein [Halomonas getboli]MCK2183001.1 glycosyltransferase [Halomonas getboli]